ncbi:ACP S-malonyltransferase [Myceligenerans xiligouense]|uniref:[acyl-carrier-protein] S-malonyltransferase n=1 Tax=Myceligenerans xiligouense TaxID=253184 RepID=A0A3N4YQC9_9MICO|nr:ACP S-malonyltransferase [Myceligenerans xiligouense]RPF20690.1 [acyl-carrier-protein] S-malonyltransferase [Myceligenerans xiligouense]
MLAVVCPGQGSQTPGMLSPWLELPGVPDLISAASEAAETDLAAHGTTSDADTIRDTAVAQPLIVASSLLALRVILDGRAADAVVDVTAGHSVGELAAAAVAGVVSDAGAAGLVSVRARAMAKAAAASPSGMSAVVGGKPDDVLAEIEAAGLWPANVNGGGQVVAAGALDGLAKLADNPPERARVIPLQVAGAFHTPFMDSARAEFEPVATGFPGAADPVLPFLADLDGTAYTGGTHGHGTASDVLSNLAGQVTAPVRWDLVMATLAARGVTALLELAPGGVLTGLAKRGLKGVEAVAVKSPDDVDAARDLIARHSTAAGTAPAATTPGAR